MAESTVRRDSLKLVVLLVCTAIIVWLCAKIFLPFLPAIVWAVALGIVIRPLHRRLERRCNGSVAAGLSVLFATLVLVIPLVLVTQQVVTEATNVVKTARSPEMREQWETKLRSQPWGPPLLNWLQTRVDIPDQLQAIAGKASSYVPAIFSGSLAGITQLVIALFTMFFLLRDREHFGGQLRYLIPLSESETEDVFLRVQDTIDASVRGRVLIAVIQGSLGGLMFWILGVPGPLLWGTLMALLSLLPLLGAHIVWIPAAIMLLLAGHPVKALILALWGGLVIGTVDNFLYPMLVGKKLQLHTLTIFFSVLGGVAAFGVAGLVIGPVVIALADALFDVWARRTRTAMPAVAPSA